MQNSYFIPVEDWHIDYMQQYARDEDRAEVMASHGFEMDEALVHALASAEQAYSLTDDTGIIYCVTGVNPVTLLSDKACAWMLSSVHMKKSPRQLLRHTRGLLDGWNKSWHTLYNMVDARYEQALRWAQWAGFEVMPAVPLGPFSMPFHPILRHRA